MLLRFLRDLWAGKADPHKSTCLGKNGGVNAYDFPAGIINGPPLFPGLMAASVCDHPHHGALTDREVTVQCAYEAGGCSMLKAERVSDCDGPLSNH